MYVWNNSNQNDMEQWDKDFQLSESDHTRPEYMKVIKGVVNNLGYKPKMMVQTIF